MSGITKRALSRVGQSAIAARMTEAEIERDPAKAMLIAMDAMRATLGLTLPDHFLSHPSGKD